MSKYVFFDIDGTIWDFHQRIPESTVRAIKLLRAAGHKAYINTGRSRGNVIDVNLWNLGFDGIIAGCGTHLEENGRIISEKLLSWEQLQRLQKVLNEHNMPAVYEGTVYHYFSLGAFRETGDSYVEYLKKRLGDRALDYSEMNKDSRVNKCSCNISCAINLQQAIEQLSDFDFIIHDNIVCEIVPHGYNKAYGIKHLMDLKNIPPDDIYAVGDSMNDIDMIRFARHSIAMGNATEKIKEEAEFVTTDLD
jgi:Cof subfamily protein (haloacid dehalogenase superfamily)